MKSAKLFAVACLLLGWQAGPACAADNAPPPSVAAALGNDISWPQCGTHLPKPAKFAVIGVNGGRPGTVNPCLAGQLTWAAGTADAATGTPVPVYVNTANPGPAGSWWWPRSNTYRGQEVSNPYGMCHGTAAAACAYIYGYAMAFDDVNLRGIPDPKQRLWWLDVETGNSWSHDTGSNRAALEGMTGYLQSIGAETGIYSTTYQFRKIAGSIDPPSNLNKLADWIPGATSPASAQAKCASAPLTPGGTIALTQFTAGSLDYNVACPTLPPAPPSETTPGPSTVQAQQPQTPALIVPPQSASTPATPPEPVSRDPKIQPLPL